ncbi:hypothetical protein Mapa_012975 [Marchantia paleacea]|nr:hypothetical protein Mapa_012975 [Marchantia paleacea]
MKGNYCVLILVLYSASLNFTWCRRMQLLESAAQESGLLKHTDIVYEEGYAVRTVLDNNKINVSIYDTFPVPGKDFVYALDMQASQVLKLKLPINHDTVIGQYAGSEDGEAGHRDGWGKYSMFNHPKDLAVDDDGNVYVADVRDCVIRKIDQAGMVYTIAGESNVSGYADGEGKSARFSADFALTYISSMCSLLVSDRGNRKLRLVQLKTPEACERRNNSSGFSVGLQGVIFIIGSTMVISALAVLIFKNVKLREMLAGLQLGNRLMWRRGSDLYTPLQNNGLPQLMPNGMQPPLHTSSLPANLGGQHPDLIDFSISTPAANRPHHNAFILDGDNSCIGPNDPAASSARLSGSLAYTQSAPATLGYDQDDPEDDQRLVRNTESRGSRE